MSQSVLVLAPPGSGKSTSIRNLNPKETFIINCIGKSLPWKGWKKQYTLFSRDNPTGNMFCSTVSEEIIKVLNYINTSRPEIKNIVLDDVQYIMSFEFMTRAKEKGFDKFTEIGQKFFNVIRLAQALREDVNVIFLSHSEELMNNGYSTTKMKTIGKVLDDKITPEGLFTVVLMATARKINKSIEYKFVTQNDGSSVAKSPMGMFDDLEIDNDLATVIKAIRDYEDDDATQVA